MAKIDPEILDSCLRRIQTGEATVAECVSENSAQAETLEPLLQLAAATRSQLAVEGPSQAFLSHSPKRVLNVVSARQQTAAPARRPRFAWRRQPAFRLAGALVALVLLLGTAGVASASTEALPGDSLYGVKRGLERAALAISLSPAGDAELLLEQANRRIAEVEDFDVEKDLERQISLKDLIAKSDVNGRYRVAAAIEIEIIETQPVAFKEAPVRVDHRPRFAVV